MECDCYVCEVNRRYGVWIVATMARLTGYHRSEDSCYWWKVDPA